MQITVLALLFFDNNFIILLCLHVEGKSTKYYPDTLTHDSFKSGLCQPNVKPLKGLPFCDYH